MNRSLSVTPIKSKIFEVGQNLESFILDSLKNIKIKEKSILVITSKIVSLSENRIVPKHLIDKDQLITQEADHDLGEIAFGCRLTIKHGLFIPAAGIDESNSADGSYILFPKDPFLSAERIHAQLVAALQIKYLGILISDSHTLPLRQGVTGIALSYWGFNGVKNMVGQKDLFGRQLKMTKMDLVDGLAASSVMMMGEADESCPVAIIEGAPVQFCERTDPTEIHIPPHEDLYYPLYKNRIVTKY